MSQDYNRRPSELVGIEDAYVAWCFDEAIYRWGSHVENELEKVDGKNKDQINARRQRVLKGLLLGKEKSFSMPNRQPISREEAGL